VKDAPLALLMAGYPRDGKAFRSSDTNRNIETCKDQQP
jgi:hypothetical protein